MNEQDLLLEPSFSVPGTSRGNQFCVPTDAAGMRQ